MVQQLEESVLVQETPDPSVLMAMNLAEQRGSDAYKLLLRMIQEEAKEKAQGRGGGRCTCAVAPSPGRPNTSSSLHSTWGLGCQVLGLHTPSGCSLVPTDMTSGGVALHVLALLSSCVDPQHVQVGSISLVEVLQQKMDEEMTNLGELG